MKPSSRRIRVSLGFCTQRGFTLIELMIAMVLSLLVLAALATIFVADSRNRNESERSSQRIENGRYAVETLGDDLEMAGYLGEYDPTQGFLATPATLPDPCATSVANLVTALPLHIQGYDGGATLSCLTDVRASTDIVVIRRASTCVSGATDCAAVAGAPYFQAALCTAQLSTADPTNQYRLDTNIANLNRTKKNCTTLADARRYLVHIYFVANNDTAGDGIPTLKRADLGSGGFSIVSIAEGVENLQLEYGIDTDANGIPEAISSDPSSFGGCVGVGCVNNWRNTMNVKLNLLSRNLSTSTGYTDSKVYTMGLNAAGTASTLGPFSDGYKRHLYQTVVRLQNPAGRLAP